MHNNSDNSMNSLALAKSRKNSAKVREFMEVFDQNLDQNIFDNSAHISRLLELRLLLINESIREFNDAVDRFCLFSSVAPDEDFTDREILNCKRVAFIDIFEALTNVLYSSYGFFHAFGVDPDRTFNIVYCSNMTKLDEGGQPIYREDGKVLKGPFYVPPDFISILYDYNIEIGMDCTLADLNSLDVVESVF